MTTSPIPKHQVVIEAVRMTVLAVGLLAAVLIFVVAHFWIGAIVVTRPSHGALALNADGSFRYTPAAGFSGTDRFSYRASDGSLTSAPATVTLRVAAAPPIVDTTWLEGSGG